MREIKFRAWDKERKAWWTLDGTDKLSVLNDEAFEIMLYTGLKDKNGKEIYEGDIVKCYEEDVEAEPYIKKVSWYGDDCHYPAFDLDPMDDYIECNGLQYYAGVQPNGEQIEIIGNIYENPELLEAK